MSCISVKAYVLPGHGVVEHEVQVLSPSLGCHGGDEDVLQQQPPAHHEGAQLAQSHVAVGVAGASAGQAACKLSLTQP